MTDKLRDVVARQYAMGPTVRTVQRSVLRFKDGGERLKFFMDKADTYARRSTSRTVYPQDRRHYSAQNWMNDAEAEEFMKLSPQEQALVQERYEQNVFSRDMSLKNEGRSVRPELRPYPPDVNREAPGRRFSEE